MNQSQQQQQFNNNQQPQMQNNQQPQQTFNNQQPQQMNQSQQQQQFNNNQQPQMQNNQQPQQTFNNQQPQQMNQSQQPQQFNNNQQPQMQGNQNVPQQQFNNQQPQMQGNQNVPQQQFNNQQSQMQGNQNVPQQQFNNQQSQQMNQSQPQQFNNNQQPQMQNNQQPQQTFNNQSQQPQQMNQPQQFNNNQQPQQINQQQQISQSQPQQFNSQQAQLNNNQFNQSQPQQFNNNQQPQMQANQNIQQQQFSNQQPQQMNQPQSQNSMLNNDLQAQQQLFGQKLQAQMERLEQGDDFLAKQQQLKSDLQAAKTVLLKQPLQNTPQTMETMKNVAQMLMKNPEITTRDAETLNNFINNKQEMLSEGEARHLQNLLRLCQQNVPITVQQAAVQQKLPDLPRLWAFMQLCDMASLTSKLSAKAFKRAGRDVAEFANAMRQSMGGENFSVQNAAQNQRSLQMMMPLYIGDNDNSYPTYLHVYDENGKDKETGEDKKETWLRICILTDNIGAVELTFRMYESNQLDMRFYFSERAVAREFRTYIPSIKEKLKETTLNVGEVRIGAVGEKMTE